ncbi:hypothetical protein [Sorangium atrum]|uniref:Uncharacterized protein n=1 Tax=Sorangium atrum TaxID=2995308 RepID=A0ABT5BR33_9BACT|nr:hypothetical protein [Sorangium aterium]MDC0676625.1 hypothetical protein [Sorangium aterium]
MALDQTALAASAARTTVRKALVDDIAKNHPIPGAHVKGRLIDLHTHFLCDDVARIGLVRTSNPDGPCVVRRSTEHVVTAPGSRDLEKDLEAMPFEELADRRAAAWKLPRRAMSASGS